MPHDVYISYAQQDHRDAEAACATLESQGVRCWIAPRDMAPGAHWAEEITGAIKQARAIVVILSENANQSPQVKREVEYAANRRLPILPVRLQDVMMSKNLAFFLGNSTLHDAFPAPLDFQPLVDAVRAVLSRAVPQRTPSRHKPRASEDAFPAPFRYGDPRRNGRGRWRLSTPCPACWNPAPLFPPARP